MLQRFAHLFADFDEDLRPRLISWSISLAAAAAWLTIVHLSPPVSVGDIVRAEPPAVVDFVTGNRVVGDASAAIKPKGSIATPHIAGANVAQAFASTLVKKVATDVAALIGGVEAVRVITSSVITGEKATLGTDTRRTTPGAASFGNDAGVRGQVGTVAHGAEVRRAEMTLKPLAVVAAPLTPEVAIDATEAAAFVRARAAQLQYCYTRTAGAESDLAGVVTLRIVLGPNGSVRDAAIVRRTWSGPAAADTEACILTMARGWRVDSGAEGSTLTLPISFTRNR